LDLLNFYKYNYQEKKYFSSKNGVDNNEEKEKKRDKGK